MFFLFFWVVLTMFFEYILLDGMLVQDYMSRVSTGR